MMWLYRAIVMLGLSLGLSAPALAQFDISQVELRGGVFAHSVDEPMFDATRIQDLNVELLYSIPAVDEAVRVGQFRPHLGGTFNFGGLESMVYAGITWTVPVFDTPIFVEASFGGAVHNGDISGAVFPRRDLGCQVLFRESASIGVRITEQASIMATVEHASHASICGPLNRGLTNLGVRVGWTF